MPPKKPSGIKPPSAGGAGDAAWGKATPIPKDISAGGLDPKLDLPPDASGNYSKVVELAEKKRSKSFGKNISSKLPKKKFFEP